jgi:hypothetical protein
MSGFSKKAPKASKSASQSEPLFELPTVIRMLPLVRRVAEDILSIQGDLRKLRFEVQALDEQRRDLPWPVRQRRYQLHETISATERRARGYVHELEGLGVAVMDSKTAQLGFPTIVNGKLAFFSWLPGEDTVTFWHYDREEVRRRPVPEAWYKPIPQRTSTPRRKG